MSIGLFQEKHMNEDTMNDVKIFYLRIVAMLT